MAWQRFYVLKSAWRLAVNDFVLQKQTDGWMCGDMCCSRAVRGEAQKGKMSKCVEMCAGHLLYVLEDYTDRNHFVRGERFRPVSVVKSHRKGC